MNSRKKNEIVIKNLFLIPLILFLTGCGGGGGGGSSSSSGNTSVPTVSVAPPPPSLPAGCCSIYQTADVQAAYLAGYTGKGVSVLNLDWSGHTNTDGSSHQSLTNSVIAGPGGVATNATLIPTTTSGTPTATAWITTVSSTLASMQSGQIINMSASFRDYTSKSTINSGPTAPNIIITSSAGNDSQPTLNTDLNQALYYSGYRNNLILVGALGTDGNIASYSSKAGAAADRFVVASGVAANGMQGTSISAPIVAGYAAIIQQKFPNSTGSQISQAILDTAVMKTGWDAATYGRGQANLAGALSPQGRLK